MTCDCKYCRLASIFNEEREGAFFDWMKAMVLEYIIVKLDCQKIMRDTVIAQIEKQIDGKGTKRLDTDAQTIP